MPEVRKILYAQHAHVLEQQQEKVTRTLEPLDVEVAFATSPETVGTARDADVLIAPTMDWLPELLKQLPQLKWVHFLSAGVEKIWQMDYDWEKVTITNSSGIHAAPISEYVLGAILYFAKRFDKFVNQTRTKTWEREWLTELTGQAVLIVGAGSIGKAVAERTRFLGMDARCVARTERHDPELGHIRSYIELTQAVVEADYIIVAVPLTPETANLINRNVLQSAKNGAVLIDVSRGGVVNEQDLVKALSTKRLGGAALDVFEEEPLPQDSGLWEFPNVLITPHVSGTTPYYLERALDVFLQNHASLRAGGALPTLVSVERRY